MGTGFWSEYYANCSEYMYPYTIGYNTEINTDALKWLDIQKAQCDYGARCCPCPRPSVACA